MHSDEKNTFFGMITFHIWYDELCYLNFHHHVGQLAEIKIKDEVKKFIAMHFPSFTAAFLTLYLHLRKHHMLRYLLLPYLTAECYNV